MGLDVVELMMEVEDRFKVTLRDSECSRVRTVGDLAALVVASLPRTPSSACPTARRFVYSRIATCFPAGCDTMADLVRMTLPRELPGGHGERVAAEQTVLREVRELTAEVSGQPLEKVQPESRFYEDLQMG